MELADRLGITSVQQAAVGEQALNAFARLDRSKGLKVSTVPL